MAADSDGTLTAVVICEGDLHDPDFPKKFRSLLGKLNTILDPPKRKKRILKVNKVEPWNSVRVTLSIPKDAASKLRQLAAEGSTALRALGILSVQLEGDTVISLRLVGQEIVIRTDNNQSTSSQALDGLGEFTNLLSQIPSQQNQQNAVGAVLPSTSATISDAVVGLNKMTPPATVNTIITNGPQDPTKPIFKSPNTVCPMDGKLPTPVPTNVADIREYPFESMTQARVIHRRENTMGLVGATTPPTTQIGHLISPVVPPPPYPSVAPVAGTSATANKLAIGQTAASSPNIAISSPLLVNLLQNEANAASHPVAKIANPSGTNPPTSGPIPSILNSGQEIVIVSGGNALPAQQTNSATNFVIANSEDDLVVNKCVVNKQTIPMHHQMRVQQLSQTFMGAGDPIQQTLIHRSTGGSNNSNSSRNSSSLSVVPQQTQPQTNIVNAGNASMSVPSSLNVNKPQIQQIPLQTLSSPQSQQMQHIPNQALLRTGIAPLGQPSAQLQQIHSQTQQQIQTQTSMLPATSTMSPSHHGALQSMHSLQTGTRIAVQPSQQQSQQVQASNIASQLAVTGRPVEFRHPAATANMLPVNPTQQMQPSQSSALQHYTSTPGSHLLPPHQQQQQMLQQQHQLQNLANPLSQSTYNPRLPLKPMDSATKSSFQEFTRYQMQYNLRQEQSVGISSAKANVLPDPLGIAAHLADLDEITKTDLDSLLPGLNVNDLDLDIKDTLLDAKDLGLDLMYPGAAGNPNANSTSTTGNQRSVQAMAPIQPQQLQLYQQNQQRFTQQQELMQGATSNLTTGRPIANITGGMSGKLRNAMKASLQQKNHHGHLGDSAGFTVSKGKEKQFLINPLTGELEPIPSDESNDEVEVDPAPFSEFNSEMSNSIYSDDDNSCSTGFSKTASDHSDNERSSNSENSSKSKSSYKRSKEKKESAKKIKAPKEKSASKNTLLKEKLTQGLKEKLLGKGSGKGSSKEKSRAKGALTPIIAGASIAEAGDKNCPDKIKLRLKLEKTADGGFGQSPKRTQTAPSIAKIIQSTVTLAGNVSPGSSSPSSAGQTNTQSPGEELRVPPLHISLRGRNSVVIKNSKKEKKKSQSGGEDDETKKLASKKNNLVSDILSTNAEPFINHTGFNKIYQPAGNVNSNDSGTPISPTHNAVTANANDIRTKTQTQNHLLQRFKQKFGEDLKVEKVLLLNHEKSPVKVLSKADIKQENGSSFGVKSSLDSKEAINDADMLKRSASDIVCNSNGIYPEKRRRLSESLSSSLSGDSPYPSASSSNTKVVHISALSTPEQFTQQIKDIIGSTNVGTLPQHSSLSTTKIQKSNNNNNSATFNKSKSVAKLKSNKSVLALLKQHSSRPNDPKKVFPATIMAPTTPKSSALPQSKADTINEEKFKQKFLEASVNDWSTTSSPQLDSKIPPSTKSTDLTDESVAEINVPVNSSEPTLVPNAAPSEIITDPAIETEHSVAAISENALYSNRPPESKDFPKRDAADTPNTTLQGVRGSPGSQAQGEDSGIESMDALSEKSPHQSASPQGDTKRADSPKELNKITSVPDGMTKPSENTGVYQNIGDVDIEAALAKMEGLNEYITVCDNKANTVAVIDSENIERLNGDHSTIQNDQKMDVLVENLATNPGKDNILLAALMQNEKSIAKSIETDAGIEKIEVMCTETKDLNENKEIVTELHADSKILNDCCTITAVDSKVHIVEDLVVKAEKLDSTVFDREVVCAKADLIKQLKGDGDEKLDLKVEKIEEIDNAAGSSSSNECEEVVVINENAVKEEHMPSSTIDMDEGKEINLPSESLSTSSSSSSSEILQQLSIEIPLGESDGAQRIRTRATSKLESPLDVPKQSPSDSPATGTSKSLKLSSSAVDRLSPKISGKGLKRKRQGSESSTQSSVSDDTPAKAKKSRKSADATLTTTGASSTLPAGNKQSGRKSAEGFKSTRSASPTASKTPSLTNNSPLNQNFNDTGGISDKNLDESSDSDEPLIEVAGKVRNSKLSKLGADTDKTLRNLQHASSTEPNASITNVTNIVLLNQAKTQIATQQGTAIASGTATPNKITSTSTVQTPGKVDDKTCTMSTRRSVRMTNSKSAIGNSNHHGGGDGEKKTGNGQQLMKQGLSTTGTTGDPTTDARRKTRSAAGLDANTEGRRRRGSRDSK